DFRPIPGRPRTRAARTGTPAGREATWHWRRPPTRRLIPDGMTDGQARSGSARPHGAADEGGLSMATRTRREFLQIAGVGGVVFASGSLERCSTPGRPAVA